MAKSFWDFIKNHILTSTTKYVHKAVNNVQQQIDVAKWPLSLSVLIALCMYSVHIKTATNHKQNVCPSDVTLEWVHLSNSITKQ